MVVDTIDTSGLWCPNRNVCCCIAHENEMSCTVSGLVGLFSAAGGLAVGLTGFINKISCLIYSAAPVALTPPIATCVIMECGYCVCTRCCLKRETWEISFGLRGNEEGQD